MNADGFALRSPWYAREREGIDLRSDAALPPRIQMYDSPDFVDRLLFDPADSLKRGRDDLWTYPVPVTPDLADPDRRARLATHRLVTTGLRKLYQPVHERFYVVVVEVFCDQAGLPRAGKHDEISVSFRMRRLRTRVAGARRPLRRVATALVKSLMAESLEAEGRDPASVTLGPLDADVRDVWWADQASKAWRQQFAKDHAEELQLLELRTDRQQWIVPKRGVAPKPGKRGRWRTLGDALDAVDDAVEEEETFPMWRLPVRGKDQRAANGLDCDDDPSGPLSRSLWFGVVPTFSDEHWSAPRDGGKTALEPKLDHASIYEVECVVTQPNPKCPDRCPPQTWQSVPTEPFRLADPMDPAGTKNRTVTVTMPDLRRLAAQAGKPSAGGVRVVAPPRSQLTTNPFAGIPKPGSGRVGGAGSVCFFAVELFFIVAMFLFMMFLPIVVLAFQLWWMLALRFCITPRVSAQITADFLARADLVAAASAGGAAGAALRANVNLAFGLDTSAATGVPVTSPDWVDQLKAAPDVAAAPRLAGSVAGNADTPAPEPRPGDEPAHETSPADPLCRPRVRV
ncbi:hypothetical protein ACWFNE_06835 [Cellulomonas sp. NPDC055163]